MVTVTVTQSPIDDMWWVKVESDASVKAKHWAQRKEYRCFESNLEACIWGLRTAEQMRGKWI